MFLHTLFSINFILNSSRLLYFQFFFFNMNLSNILMLNSLWLILLLFLFTSKRSYLIMRLEFLIHWLCNLICLQIDLLQFRKLWIFLRTFRIAILSPFWNLTSWVDRFIVKYLWVVIIVLLNLTFVEHTWFVLCFEADRC